MLEVQGIWKRYRTDGTERNVLTGIDLAVGAGEIVGLVGRSGSGKSTLSRLIMQLEPVDGGLIRWNGESIGRAERKTFYSECQLIFQNASAALNPSWTVREILLEPLRKEEGDRLGFIRNMLGRVKLNEAYLDRRPTELSGGERQRVNLLRSILVGPKLLICDEIVSSLDRLVQKEIVEMLLNLNREWGMAILFISHDSKVVEYMCERIYVLANGKIIEEAVRKDDGFTFTHPYARELFIKKA
ncbi:ABC transporter ATP-binding protein [Sporosarcina sp. Te-1]|uniref:ABC transporter ATP-binding protein n=1 Tax=Sporosarcina sp. Te-1 TaxID=2818390 RepID=UPI001A9EB40B|nr:dipeptide/oligopeptide/nickel ABC transporter ATP-binding protein [Sporosarcina sp. Te-1]QTD39985.1 ABC transporter ATP-binding protein [Sporosarcina sp. Te-1]